MDLSGYREGTTHMMAWLRGIRICSIRKICTAVVVMMAIVCVTSGFLRGLATSPGMTSSEASRWADEKTRLETLKTIETNRKSRTVSYLSNHDNTADMMTRLLHGVEVEQLKTRLYDQTRTFSFMEDYKNPCWLEKLPSSYHKEYNATAYSGYGQRYIQAMVSVYEQRLNESETPWRLRCLPYFYLLGVTKSGTTDFFGSLIRHPEIYGPWVKEPMYWNRKRYPKGATVHKRHFDRHLRFQDYLNMFDYAAHMINETSRDTKPHHTQIIGDGSSYMFWEDNGWSVNPGNKDRRDPLYTTAMALNAAQPLAKLIILLRNPTDRVYSAYVMYSNNGTAQEFDRLVKYSIDAYKLCFQQHGTRICAYNSTLARQLFPISLVSSMYTVFLKDWHAVFPKKQILVIKSENYYADRIKYLNQTFRFLDIAPMSKDVEVAIQRRGKTRSQKYSAMLSNTRRQLDEFFRPFNRELNNILKIKFWQ